MQITEVADGNALGPLKEEWSALVERCARATIYQTWEWNEAWWRSFGGGKRLRLLLIRHNSALAGIAPFYVSWHFRTPLRRLAFLGTGAADYLDIIAPDEHAAAVCSAVFRHLDSTRGFDMADLQQLRPESLSRRAAPCLVESLPPSWRVEQAAQEPCPYLSLPPAWEQLTGRLGKKMRSNLGYYDRLLFKNFPDARVGLVGPDRLDAAMSATIALHQQRWNARLLPGALAGGRVQSFQRTVARRFQEAGWLRLHLTEVEGRPVAALYCFRYRHKYYYYLGGFAPDMGRYSLGTVLTSRAIQAAIGEGCAEFDFLRGSEPYKYRWQPEERINHRLLFYRRGSVRSQAMRRLLRLEQAVEHRTKQFAESRGRRRTA